MTERIYTILITNIVPLLLALLPLFGDNLLSRMFLQNAKNDTWPQYCSVIRRIITGQAVFIIPIPFLLKLVKDSIYLQSILIRSIFGYVFVLFLIIYLFIQICFWNIKPKQLHIAYFPKGWRFFVFIPLVFAILSVALSILEIFL